MPPSPSQPPSPPQTDRALPAASPRPLARRGLWWLGALLLVSGALAAATFFTYRNAETFSRERLVRAAVLYTFALERGARHLGPAPLERLDELLEDATGEEVRGVALVSRRGRVFARTGEGPAEDELASADWVQRAARHGIIALGADAGETVSVAVPSRLGCNRGPPHEPGHRERPFRRGSGGGGPWRKRWKPKSRR